MTNTDKIKDAIRDLNTNSIRIIVGCTGTVHVASRGTSNESRSAVIEARKEVTRRLIALFPSRKVFRVRRGGGTVWKGYELDCDRCANQWEAAARVEITKEEKSMIAVHGGRW